jgi:hypothetical protein
VKRQRHSIEMLLQSKKNRKEEISESEQSESEQSGSEPSESEQSDSEQSDNESSNNEPSDNEPSDSEYEPTQEYEVENILEHSINNMDEMFYLIKWVGYEEPTWEPEKNLNHCQKKLILYKVNMKGDFNN